MQSLDRFEALVAIMERLRGPQGCPWDREQDYESLRRFLLEECYEVAEALDRGSPTALKEELGDLLFQIVFLSRLAQEDGAFEIEDVIRGIAEKLIRRHPHVFGSATADTPEEVEEHWERIKRGEKSAEPSGPGAGGGSLLDGILASLPALYKARSLGERAAKVGFDWEHPEQILDQVEDELRELRSALAEGGKTAVRDEIGDVLFTIVMLARHLKIDPEAALESTNRKFRTRFGWMERELARRGTPFDAAGFELLERLWRESKAALGTSDSRH
jgi:MazG family protein